MILYSYNGLITAAVAAISLLLLCSMSCTISFAIPTNNNNNINSVFTFVYTKSGGIAGVMERVSYDSFTKSLIFINERNLVKSNYVKIIELNSSSENNLKQIMISNKLFLTQLNYPPRPGSADFFGYGLFVILDGKVHTVEWTSTSSNVPLGLFKIAEIIEKMIS